MGASASGFDPLETPIDQIRIVKMTPPDKGRGVVAPLALRARIAHAHGPEQVALAPLCAGNEAVGAIQAAARAGLTAGPGQRTQHGFRPVFIGFADRVAASPASLDLP